MAFSFLTLTTSQKYLHVSVRKLIASTISRKMHLRGNTSQSIYFQVQCLPLRNRFIGLKIIQANYFLSSIRLNVRLKVKTTKLCSVLYILSSQHNAKDNTIQSCFLKCCSFCDQGLLNEHVATCCSQVGPFITTWLPHRLVFLDLLIWQPSSLIEDKSTSALVNPALL